MSTKSRITSIVLVAACLAVALSGCATTRQTRSVKPHGFLGDYSQLEKGKGGEAQLRYINPDANFSKYNAIMLDSVTLWRTAGTTRLSAEDQKHLTDLLYVALDEELSKDYKMVNSPGPGVMRIRAAITEAKGSNVVGNTVTTIVPQARVVSILLGRATDVQVWVGKAAIEVDVTDSLSGERLAAAVDERAGAKTLRGLGGKWKDVYNAFDHWAEQLANRLEELRGS